MELIDYTMGVEDTDCWQMLKTKKTKVTDGLIINIDIPGVADKVIIVRIAILRQ